MSTHNENIKRHNTKILEICLLVTFTIFSLYFSVSSYRLYQMQVYDLNPVTEKVKSITFKKAHGKQAKPEVLIDLSKPENYRVTYGSEQMLVALSNEIKVADEITIYLKKPQSLFIDLGKDTDILQIAKSGEVIYSMEVARKSFHDSYLISTIMSFLLPLGCIFYWIKSKSNSMLQTLQHPQFRPTGAAAE